MVVTVFADGHLTFKGMEINGTLNAFSNQLTSKGYKHVYTSDDGDAKIFSGAFAGVEDCEIFVLATPNSHIVWKVVVYLPKQTTWYALKSRYEDYKNSLTNKYGAPADDFHFFSSPYYEGDGYELQALNGDKCDYAAYYDTDLGVISISLYGAGYGKGQVKIGYEDKVNTKLKNESKKESMSNDL